MIGAAGIRSVTERCVIAPTMTQRSTPKQQKRACDRHAEAVTASVEK